MSSTLACTSSRAAHVGCQQTLSRSGPFFGDMGYKLIDRVSWEIALFFKNACLGMYAGEVHPRSAV
jgi:hypothetical protein